MNSREDNGDINLQRDERSESIATPGHLSKDFTSLFLPKLLILPMSALKPAASIQLHFHHPTECPLSSRDHLLSDFCKNATCLK